MRRYNIYLRRDGRWEGRIQKGKNLDGTRKFLYFFGHSREEVYQKMQEYYQRDVRCKDCTKTVDELYEEWERSMRHRIKESTASNYIMKAQKHILPEFGTRTLSSIKAPDVYDFIEKKKKSGLSNRYIADIIVLMKSIFKYAKKTYHTANPMDEIELPRKKRPEIRLLDENEQEKLQCYVQETQTRTTLGIALALSTGLRIGELCALQWEDINLEKRTLTVRKTMQRIQCNDEVQRTKVVITEPKSESSRREIPIPDCMIGFLIRFQSDGKDFLFSGKERPIEPRTMQYRFSKILKNAELPSIHFHALRHMFATNCIRLGFDVKTLSEILGHSSVEITLNRYVHSSFEQKKQYMELIKMKF